MSNETTRFNYSIAALGKAQFQGRTVPALLTHIEEVLRPIKDKFVPGMLITYTTPAGTEEQQLYEGAVDTIPVTSSLGQLMQAFAAMGVDDIAADGYAHVKDKYLQLKVDPIRNSNTNGSSPQPFRYRRTPLRWLTDDEVQKAFGKPKPLGFLDKLVPELEGRLDGVGHANVLARLITDTTFRDHIPEIDKAVSNGSFMPWLEQHTRLRVDPNNTFKLEEAKKP